MASWNDFTEPSQENASVPGVPLSLDDARRMVQKYISYYNDTRLHSAIGYVAPLDKLECRDVEIFKERDRKLEAAREQRKQKRHKAYSENNFSESAFVH